jgi:hypothetical protein
MLLRFAILAGILAATPSPPSPGDLADGSPPMELEGIRIGESFQSVNSRLNLRAMVPFTMGDATKYIIDTRVILVPRPQAYLSERGIRRIELRLRNDKVEWIRVVYRGRDDLMFDAAGEALLGVHGEPTRVQNGGPMQVGRTKGVRLYLWLRLWTWKWDGVTLGVEGKHYGDDKVQERPKRHRYTYTLDAGPPPELPDNVVPIRQLPTAAVREAEQKDP